MHTVLVIAQIEVASKTTELFSVPFFKSRHIFAGALVTPRKCFAEVCWRVSICVDKNKSQTTAQNRAYYIHTKCRYHATFTISSSVADGSFTVKLCLCSSSALRELLVAIWVHSFYENVIGMIIENHKLTLHYDSHNLQRHSKTSNYGETLAVARYESNLTLVHVLAQCDQNLKFECAFRSFCSDLARKFS